MLRQSFTNEKSLVYVGRKKKPQRFIFLLLAPNFYRIETEYNFWKSKNEKRSYKIIFFIKQRSEFGSYIVEKKQCSEANILWKFR